MVLYAADVIDMTPQVKKVRKPRQKKVSETLTETAEKIENELEDQVESVEPVIKKRRVSKKKEPEMEIPTEIKPMEEVKVEPIETVIADAEPVKKKRNTEKMIAAKKAKKEELERMKQELETLRSKVEKPVKKRNTNPPKWFQSYVEKVQKDESVKTGSKKENKEIKSEALEIAKKTWDDGFTRDKVEQEFETHQHRLYSMIFSK
jgi:hypothetical protein